MINEETANETRTSGIMGSTSLDPREPCRSEDSLSARASNMLFKEIGNEGKMDPDCSVTEQRLKSIFQQNPVNGYNNSQFYIIFSCFSGFNLFVSTELRYFENNT